MGARRQQFLNIFVLEFNIPQRKAYFVHIFTRRDKFIRQQTSELTVVCRRNQIEKLDIIRRTHNEFDLVLNIQFAKSERAFRLTIYWTDYVYS